MKRFLNLLRHILPYWPNALINFIANFLSVIFSLFSFTMVIPFLGILFDNQKVVSNSQPLELTFESVQHNFNYFLSQIIIQQGASAALATVVTMVVIMFFFKTGFYYVGRFFMASLRMNVIRDIRNKIYQKVLQLPLSYYSEERKGDIIARSTGDVQEIEVSIIHSINVLFKEPITIIVYISSLFFMSWELSLFVLVLLPVAGLIIGRIGRTLRKKSLAGQQKIGLLLSLMEEALSGLRIIKAFNSEQRIFKRFDTENQNYTDIMVKMWRRKDLAMPLSEFMGAIAIVVVMWYGGSLVLQNESALTSQEFIGYLVIFSQVINPAKAFSTAYYNIQKGMASAERIDDILEADIRIHEKENATTIEQFSSAIEYRNVSFRYETEWVLKDIQLRIPKGKMIALVGQSGSGKSTFVDLLPRFYDVPEGDILIDDISIKDLKIKSLRELMGNVNQESILFNDTIFNNIAFGVETATDAQVIAAAKVANAHNFIMETPEGYQTNIGDSGSKLSGGQRQRISIARAVLKNPPILILDEATSALDTESERMVQDALNKLMANRTSIVIAHRLSTIKNADEIYVMHEGRIVEHGRHNELLEKKGVYKKLHDLQTFA